MSRVIYYHPYTQFENKGDMQINKRLIDNLRRYGDLKVLKKNIPHDFWVKLNVSASEQMVCSKFNFFIRMLIRSLFSADEVYYFTKPGDIKYIAKSDIPIGGFVKTLALFMLKASGVKICAAGISASDGHKEQSMLENFALNQFHTRIFRDSISYQNSLNSNYKSLLGSDLAFSISDFIPNNKNKNVDAETINIAISFRDMEEDHITECLINVLGRLAQKCNVKISAVVQVDRDYEYMDLISKAIGINEVCYVNDIHDYGVYDLVISNRLHVLIFSMLNSCSPIALISKKNKKVISLFEDLALYSSLKYCNKNTDLDEKFKLSEQSLKEIIHYNETKMLEAFDNLFVRQSL